MIKINDKIFGFTVVRERVLDEIPAKVYELKHEGCGAELLYIDREDSNKTFAIAFATPPENDTGVPHIIEHSVLCGSKKYPLKDPFAELLKGSLNTFLNAMTYEDRTVYPVSSRCEKDFLSLIDVYMDAVLSPAMLENPNIFRQEGWHYEYDEESDTLSINGVVYNEMKGAYSSPDELGASTLAKALFEGTSYAKDSGGDPNHIPELTYEGFLDFYKRHYNPTGAKIVLDGKMDIEKPLEVINAHLSRFSYSESAPTYGESVKKITPPITIPYEISENEDEKGRARVLFGYVIASHSDAERQLGATILSEVLSGTNASPLKKALLDKGLCKDASMYLNRSRETALILEVRDTDEDKYPEIKATLEEVVGTLIREGIDKAQLTSTIDNIDFKTRERDFGSLPLGVVHATTLFGSWFFEKEPEDSLLSIDAISAMRQGVEEGLFEKYLDEMILSSNHSASVIMVPDKELGERLRREECERLAKIRRSLTDEELEKIKDEYSAFKSWQESEESDEAISSLPSLALSDINDSVDITTTEESHIGKAKILRHSVETNGIVYISLHFNADDLKEEELMPLSILSSSITNLPTKHKDVLTLQGDIKAKCGTFYSSAAAIDKEGTAHTYLTFFASCLESKAESVASLLCEILTDTLFGDGKEILDIAKQAKSHIEDAMITSGESTALSRVEASYSDAGIISEHLSGYEAYKSLCKALKTDEDSTALLEKVEEIYRKLIKRERLTLSISGNLADGLAERIVGSIPEDDGDYEPTAITSCADSKEFFVIPSKVAYSAYGAISECAKEKLGILRVARSLLSYEYLWNTVRVKNGAYGTGFIPRRGGQMIFYSYRDPSPNNSVVYFRESAEYLRDLANSGIDLTKFIIGAVGEYDMLTTPKTKALLATRRYLAGIAPDEERKIRRDMLAMTSDDLSTIADMIDEIAEHASLVIVGAKEHLDAMKDGGFSVIKI